MLRWLVGSSASDDVCWAAPTPANEAPIITSTKSVALFIGSESGINMTVYIMFLSDPIVDKTGRLR